MTLLSSNWFFSHREGGVKFLTPLYQLKRTWRNYFPPKAIVLEVILGYDNSLWALVLKNDISSWFHKGKINFRTKNGLILNLSTLKIKLTEVGRNRVF